MILKFTQLFIFIAENQKDFIQLLATVTNSPGSGWIEPVSETQSEDLFKRSVQTLSTNQNQPFMHLEFQVKKIDIPTSHVHLTNQCLF